MSIEQYKLKIQRVRCVTNKRTMVKQSNYIIPYEEASEVLQCDTSVERYNTFLYNAKQPAITSNF